MLSPSSAYRRFYFPMKSISESRLQINKYLQIILGSSYRTISSSLGVLETTERYPYKKINLFSISIENSSVQSKRCQRKPSSLLVSKASSSLLLSSRVVPQADPITEVVKSNVRLIGNCKATQKKYSGLLQESALKEALCFGKAIHGNIIRIGLDPDAHLWICLINMYAKCGKSQHACQILDEMPKRDVVAWTVLIGGSVARGNGREGITLYCKMRRDNVLPNGFTFANASKACTMCLALELGKQLNGEVIKTGFLSDIFVGSAIVDLYAKCGEVELAEGVFFSMPNQNVVSLNALLNAYAQIGDNKRILRLLGTSNESETRLSKFTLSSVLKGCASLGNPRQGQTIHSLTIKIGYEFDAFLSSSLVHMYSVCGMTAEAFKVFARIENPDVILWSTMIACFVQHGYKYEAAQLFNEMRQTGGKPNHFTLSSLVTAAIELADSDYGDSIHACVWKLGLELDNSIGNALVRMYMKAGFLKDGISIFNAMTNPDLISWNALLSGFHDGYNCYEGPRIFKQMLADGFKPNKYTFICILRSCSSLQNLYFGHQLHGQVIKNNLDADNFVGTALVDMYAKCGSLENADLVFSKLRERDTFTWTAIITGYAQINQGETAIRYYCKMQQEGACPNEFTFSSYLRACCGIAALENGRQLHSHIIKSGESDDLFIASALVDMYSKCGCLKDAEAVFSNLVSRDTVSWNTIICGYSQHGHREKALEAFQCMLDEGVKPDQITFIGILSACSHVGLIEEGRKYFNSLSNLYEITPTIEHYACMVDMLGRAGKLDEAENLIENMTLEPNSLIWQTLLGACSKSGNMELGEKAARKLLELEPEVDSTYILLSNIYAAKGKWDDVAKVRARMTCQGVKKEPGCSWVEVNGQVHVFVPNDVSHPNVHEIYQKLEELGLDLSSAGYIPNIDSVYHNVSNSEKTKSLSYHSERLALAFALVSKGPKKPIRIFKNLRMCGDCHNAIKLISDFTNREIIIRDISHFHHFQNGSCSCQDYW